MSKRKNEIELLSSVHPMFASSTSLSGARGTTKIGGSGCISELDANNYSRAVYQTTAKLLGISDPPELTDTDATDFFNGAHGSQQVDGLTKILEKYDLLPKDLSCDEVMDYEGGLGSAKSWESIETTEIVKFTADEKADLKGWYVRKYDGQSGTFMSPWGFRLHGKKNALLFVRDCQGSLKKYIVRTGKSFTQLARA